MRRLSVNIDSKKPEKAIKKTSDLNYDPVHAEYPKSSLNNAEQRLYSNLKGSFEQIKLHQEGKIKLQNAKEALAEIEASLKS